MSAQFDTQGIECDAIGQPPKKGDTQSFNHTNPITGKNFADLTNAEGIRTLDEQMHQNRYAHAEWAAFKQWQKSSPPRNIKRGQKGTKLFTKSGANFWYVFNIDQTAPKANKE